MVDKEDIVNELSKIRGVSVKCAEGMYLLGIRKKEDLIGKNADLMYAELRERKDFFAEPCMQNMLRIAVAMSERE